MVMAFHAIMANKMRSFLTMLGIIIGIGSVISIVSIGDTMRGLFADLYKDAGNDAGSRVDRILGRGRAGTAIISHWMTWRRSGKCLQTRSHISTVMRV